MKKQQLIKLLEANNVPELVYDWNFTEFDGTPGARKFRRRLSSIDDLIIKSRQCLFICIPSDPLMASRLAVTFLKAAFISGFLNCSYATPESISQLRAAGWKTVDNYDRGEGYGKLLHADFVVLDKVNAQLDDFRAKSLNEFIEQRTLLKRSTIMASSQQPETALKPNTIAILRAVDCKVVGVDGSSRGMKEGKDA